MMVLSCIMSIDGVSTLGFVCDGFVEVYILAWFNLHVFLLLRGLKLINAVYIILVDNTMHLVCRDRQTNETKLTHNKVGQVIKPNFVI